VGQARKISLQILCRVGQPDPLFACQVQGRLMRGEPTRIATPIGWNVASEYVISACILVEV